MVALGETWRNLSAEEKLGYNNQAKFVFKVKTTTSDKQVDNTLPSNLSKDSDQSLEEEEREKQKTVNKNDDLERGKTQDVESESDSNDEISDSSVDPDDVN